MGSTSPVAAMSTEQFERAAAATACQALAAGGSALIGSGVASLPAGGAGLIPLTLGAASLFAANYACSPTPVGPNPAAPPANTSGCIKSNGGSFPRHESPDGTSGGAGFPGYEWVSIDEVIEEDGPSDEFKYYTVTATHLDGSPRSERQLRTTGTTFTLDLGPGATCLQDADSLPPPPPDYTTPREYTDPITNCQMIVTPQGFITSGEGQPVRPVFKIEAAPAPGARASGGVIGGCNFSPIIHVGGGGGQPPTDAPWDPTWPDQPGGGTPPWVPIVAGLIGGAVAPVIQNMLDQLFETKYDAGSKTIFAACEYKEDGTPESLSINFPVENYQSRVLTALDAIVAFQQQILLWKTPTCSGGGSSVSGDPVTINWVSDEYSSAGGNRLRKLLTYFDQVGSTLEQTVAHWKDFTWNAGPVIVSVNDVPLGKPQVWAASVDEGKRVINHAAAIAGVDMTKASWVVTTPRASRYGEVGTMRVHRSKNGTLGITKRDGPSGLPPALI